MNNLEAKLLREDALVRRGLESGSRVMVSVHLPQWLVRRLVDYAERHSEDVSMVVEQAMRRALREQKL